MLSFCTLHCDGDGFLRNDAVERYWVCEQRPLQRAQKLHEVQVLGKPSYFQDCARRRLFRARQVKPVVTKHGRGFQRVFRTHDDVSWLFLRDCDVVEGRDQRSGLLSIFGDTLRHVASRVRKLLLQI
jgi:hypothetical protein